MVEATYVGECRTLLRPRIYNVCTAVFDDAGASQRRKKIAWKHMKARFGSQPTRHWWQPHQAIAALTILKMEAQKCANFWGSAQCEDVHPEPALP